MDCKRGVFSVFSLLLVPLAVFSLVFSPNAYADESVSAWSESNPGCVNFLKASLATPTVMEAGKDYIIKLKYENLDSGSSCADGEIFRSTASIGCPSGWTCKYLPYDLNDKYNPARTYNLISGSIGSDAYATVGKGKAVEVNLMVTPDLGSSGAYRVSAPTMTWIINRGGVQGVRDGPGLAPVATIVVRQPSIGTLNCSGGICAFNKPLFIRNVRSTTATEAKGYPSQECAYLDNAPLGSDYNKVCGEPFTLPGSGAVNKSFGAISMKNGTTMAVDLQPIDPTKCGNGILNYGEACDKTAFPFSITCKRYGGASTQYPSCSSDCRDIDSSACAQVTQCSSAANASNQVQGVPGEYDNDYTIEGCALKYRASLITPTTIDSGGQYVVKMKLENLDNGSACADYDMFQSPAYWAANPCPTRWACGYLNYDPSKPYDRTGPYYAGPGAQTANSNLKPGQAVELNLNVIPNVGSSGIYRLNAGTTAYVVNYLGKGGWIPVTVFGAQAVLTVKQPEKVDLTTKPGWVPIGISSRAFLFEKPVFITTMKGTASNEFRVYALGNEDSPQGFVEAGPIGKDLKEFTPIATVNGAYSISVNKQVRMIIMERVDGGMIGTNLPVQLDLKPVDPAKCGNGALDYGEACDNNAFHSDDKSLPTTCATYGFIGGQLKCDSDCRAVDTSKCLACGQTAQAIDANTSISGDSNETVNTTAQATQLTADYSLLNQYTWRNAFARLKGSEYDYLYAKISDFNRVPVAGQTSTADGKWHSERLSLNASVLTPGSWDVFPAGCVKKAVLDRYPGQWFHKIVPELSVDGWVCGYNPAIKYDNSSELPPSGFE